MCILDEYKRSVNLSPLLCKMFTLDLVLMYIDKLWVFQWVPTVLPLQPIYSYFVMKDISCSLSLGIRKLKLLKLSLQRLDIWMVC